jgi:hypothetical protein
METVIKIGDLVREDIFKDASVFRYGIVIDELNIKGIVHDKMCKVYWASCKDFPVSSNIYTCFVSEKQIEVVS